MMESYLVFKIIYFLCNLAKIRKVVEMIFQSTFKFFLHLKLLNKQHHYISILYQIVVILYVSEWWCLSISPIKIWMQL